MVQQGQASTYKSVLNTNIAPPLRDLDAGVRDTEEDDDSGDDQPCVKASSGDVIVVVPPTRVSTPDDLIEDEAKVHP